MIRPLSSSDAAIYRAVRLQSLWEQPTAFSTSPMDEPDLATTALRLSANRDHCFFGSFVEGQLVGIIRYFRHEAVNERHRAQLGGLYVQPKFRRQGHGRALVNAVLGRARETSGVERIGLHVVTTRLVAIRLYESLGFVRQGTEVDAFSNGGVLHDEHLMSLDLRWSLPVSGIQLAIREAAPADCPLLAELNQQLIADEGGERRTISELRELFGTWLAAGHRAVLFESGGSVAAYVLFHEGEEAISLRQFFVVPGLRNAGVEEKVARLLLENVWPADRRIRVETPADPPAAAAFWRALGFEDRKVLLERSGKIWNLEPGA